MSTIDLSAQRLSYRTAAAILAVSVLLAFASSRMPTLTPAQFLLFAPTLLLAGALLWIAFDLWITWWTERVVLRRFEDAKRQLDDGQVGGRRARADTTGTRPDGPARSSKEARRRIVPPLIFTSPAAWSVTQTRASWEATTASHRPPHPLAPPLLAAAIDDLFELIMRDFIVSWYGKISDSPVFPNAVEKTIRETLGSLTDRLTSLDWSDLIVGKVLPLVTTHVETFRTAEQALRGQDLRTRLTESDELDLFLAERYASETKSAKLHPAVDVASPNSRPAEEAWLTSLVGKLLPHIMPEREAESAAVRIMAREILANAVILPIIDMLSDPDFWNQKIDDKAGAAIRDQQMVNQFREALDKQDNAISSAASLHAASSVRKARRTEEISAKTDDKQFAAFVRGIGKCNSLIEARRLRSDVASQIRKTKAQVAGKSKEEVVDGQKVSELLDYIVRLSEAKKKADKRIEQLGGILPGSSRYSMATDSTPVKRPRRALLRDILLQPTSLSYFTEFQDRRRRSLRVQFWLLVEGLKDPLEDVGSDAEGESHLPPPSTETVETTKEDMKMIWDAYFASNSLSSNQKYLRIVRNFLEADPTLPVSTQDIRKVRRAVIAAQQDVFTEMEEEDFPDFEKSDLYFKALADLPESSPPEPLPFFSSPSPSPSPTTGRRPSLPPHSYSSPSPSPRTLTSPLPYSSSRTEKAPPKVTLKAVFDQRPITRRVGSDGSNAERRPRSPTGSLSSLTELGAGKRRPTALSDSLDFLMSPPAEEEDHRSPLFGDQDDSGGETPDGDGTKLQLSDDDYVQVQTIEAIQEALNSILATDARSSSRNSNRAGEIASRHFSANPGARKPSNRDREDRTNSPTRTERITSVSSTRSAPESRRRSRGVFDDDEELYVDEDEPEEPEPEFDPSSIRLAAPGDLHLPIEIARLEAAIEKLRNQEAVVGALIRKAELTGNASELKILVKSRDSLRRETRSLEFQKNQYEVQSENNKLVPGRTKVTISGTTVSQSGSGQSFQLYLVEVHQIEPDGSFASGWIVTRRYSEFSVLHANLSDRFSAARQLSFPSKRLVATYSEAFIEQRRAGLEKYLQALVLNPIICQSNELRSFLSQQNISLPQLDVDAGKRNASYFPGQGLVRSFYRSVTSGLEEVFTAGPSSMMDTIIQRLSQQAADISGIGGPGVQDEDLVGQLLAGKGGLPSDLRGNEEGLTYFTAPICDLFVTLFELKEKNNWLRRQAILIILQQVLGGTIERKFRDGVKMLKSPQQLTSYIGVLKNAMWPGGQRKKPEPPRTALQRAATRESANQKLSALMPDVAANLIGRANARQGARRLFAVLQNRRLNRHLIYSIVDAVLNAVFPELAPPVGPTLPPIRDRTLSSGRKIGVRGKSNCVDC
ncbi:structural protein MDM1 [Pseudohyphozyma bogoriensis]|nr:structural protein MDM1 [Pseudohyphozyma bogoriensis]